ncbi:uncharacterized protein LOC124814608 [Hydra vulgaris]|uniref:uncharacterized protein LOC124814608 n=1 Tax=Hydra vulgaris TaxID=6087 RepID=UPI0032EA0623
MLEDLRVWIKGWHFSGARSKKSLPIALHCPVGQRFTQSVSHVLKKKGKKEILAFQPDMFKPITLLSQSQNFSTQDFQDGQIATMEDGKETVSILNIEDLDDTSDVQSIVTIPDEEPTQSTSGCNKRRNSDDEKTLNKIAKTEPVRKNKKTNFSSEYLKIANKNLDVQIRSQELRIREVVALERICDATENASKAQIDVSKAQVEYYKFLIKK